MPLWALDTSGRRRIMELLAAGATNPIPSAPVLATTIAGSTTPKFALEFSADVDLALLTDRIHVLPDLVPLVAYVRGSTAMASRAAVRTRLGPKGALAASAHHTERVLRGAPMGGSRELLTPLPESGISRLRETIEKVVAAGVEADVSPVEQLREVLLAVGMLLVPGVHFTLLDVGFVLPLLVRICGDDAGGDDLGLGDEAGADAVPLAEGDESGAAEDSADDQSVNVTPPPLSQPPPRLQGLNAAGRATVLEAAAVILMQTVRSGDIHWAYGMMDRLAVDAVTICRLAALGRGAHIMYAAAPIEEEQRRVATDIDGLAASLSAMMLSPKPTGEEQPALSPIHLMRRATAERTQRYVQEFIRAEGAAMAPEEQKALLRTNSDMTKRVTAAGEVLYATAVRHRTSDGRRFWADDALMSPEPSSMNSDDPAAKETGMSGIKSVADGGGVSAKTMGLSRPTSSQSMRVPSAALNRSSRMSPERQRRGQRSPSPEPSTRQRPRTANGGATLRAAAAALFGRGAITGHALKTDNPSPQRKPGARPATTMSASRRKVPSQRSPVPGEKQVRGRPGTAGVSPLLSTTQKSPPAKSPSPLRPRPHSSAGVSRGSHTFGDSWHVRPKSAADAIPFDATGPAVVAAKRQQLEDASNDIESFHHRRTLASTLLRHVGRGEVQQPPPPPRLDGVMSPGLLSQLERRSISPASSFTFNGSLVERSVVPPLHTTKDWSKAQWAAYADFLYAHDHSTVTDDDRRRLQRLFPQFCVPVRHVGESEPRVSLNATQASLAASLSASRGRLW